MFKDIKEYKFTSNLSNNWKSVLNEYKQLKSEDLALWPETFLHNNAWSVFGFYGRGKRINVNCEKCPKTTALLESIPGMTNAAFSVLEPGARIRPHVGYSDKVLRTHLAIITPKDCGLRVGPDVYQWKEGEVVVFDDTVEHEAWNKSAQTRVVLLLDFKR